MNKIGQTVMIYSVNINDCKDLNLSLDGEEIILFIIM